MYEYDITNLALDLEKKLKCYEQKIPKENKEYIFSDEKNLDLLNILLNLKSDDVEQRIEEFNNKYSGDMDYGDLVIRNEKLIYQTHEITGLASELFDRLYHINMETSFKEFSNILINKIGCSISEQNWFSMSFKNEYIKNYFLDEATKYIIANQCTMKDYIDKIKLENIKREYYIDEDNIPKKFDNLFDMYDWFIVNNNFNLELIGSKFLICLLDVIITNLKFGLYSNNDKRINEILEKCRDDMIIIYNCLYSYPSINIKFNIYLLSHSEYAHFALLNIIKANQRISNLKDKEFDYEKEWKELIIRQAINIYFKHYKNITFEKELIFYVLNHLSYYAFEYGDGNEYFFALEYLLNKLDKFNMQIYQNKEFYSDKVIIELLEKQIRFIESNDLFNTKDYFLISFYIEKLDTKNKIYDTNYKELIQKTLISVESNLQKQFLNHLLLDRDINYKYLDKINFSILYKLSNNKTKWYKIIKINFIKSIITKKNAYQIYNIIKCYFFILLDIYKNNLENNALQKVIIKFVLHFGIKTASNNIFNSMNDKYVSFEFYKLLDNFEDSLFDKFIKKVFYYSDIKQILDIFTHTTIANRIYEISRGIIPILEQKHNFFWLPELEETILLAYHLELYDFADKLILKFEEYKIKNPGKDFSGLKHVICKKEIQFIFKNNKLSLNEKAEKLNNLESLKEFDINIPKEKNTKEHCEKYRDFIKALIYYDKNPKKTYNLLRKLFEYNDNNALYFFNMLSAYFKAYQKSKYKIEKFSFILNEFEDKIISFIKKDNNLFYLQILIYGYNQINNFIKLNQIYKMSPNHYRKELEDYLPDTVKIFDRDIYYKNKLLICVEGENDINFLKNINNIEELKNIINISTSKNIEFYELGGGKLEKFVKEYKLKSTNIVELHIYDSDKGSGKNDNKYQKQLELIKNRNDKSFCFITQKRELENYIPWRLIKEKFPEVNMIKIEDKNWNELDIPSLLIGKTKFKDSKKEELQIKQILNGDLTTKIKKEDLEELNAFDEIKSWFEKIKELSSF